MLILGGFIALAAGLDFLGGKVESAQKKEAKVVDQTGIVTSPAFFGHAHPPQYDVWKQPLSCHVDPASGQVVGDGKVKNNSGNKSWYVISVEVTRGGTSVGEARGAGRSGRARSHAVLSSHRRRRR